MIEADATGDANDPELAADVARCTRQMMAYAASADAVPLGKR